MIHTKSSDDIYAVLENAESRKIILPEFMETAGVESDEKVRSLKFKFPKTVDNADLTQMQLRINYMNSRGEKGQHIVTDLQPFESDDSYVTFSWPFSRMVTHYRGLTKFVVCAVKTEEDGTISAEWNTALVQLKVNEGLEFTEDDINDEEESIIDKLISICQSSADEAAQSAQQAQEEAEKVLSIIPVGGTKGQVLTKQSDEDKDYNWQNPTGGGGTGQNGATFTPSVSAEGVISWTNDRNLPNPDPVKIKGDKGDRGEPGLPGTKGDKGDPGEPGTSGKDGFSPVVKTEPIEGGTRVTIIDKEGNKTFDVLNVGEKGDKGDPGERGPAGADGADGKTPIKGVDYFTESDKQELIEAVIAKLPVYKGEAE